VRVRVNPVGLRVNPNPNPNPREKESERESTVSLIGCLANRNVTETNTPAEIHIAGKLRESYSLCLVLSLSLCLLSLYACM